MTSPHPPDDFKSPDTEKEIDLTSAEPDDDYPEGGVRAWLTVCGAFFLQFVTGYINAFGVFEDFYKEDYLNHFTSSQISWIGGMTTFFLFTGGFASGRFFDLGYFYYLILGGSALSIFCLFMLSLTQPQHFYQAFLSQGIGLGIGLGTLFVPSVAVVSQWFNRRRAVAMGIMSSGVALGSIVHPIMLNNLIHGRVGFANGIRASAGLVAGCLVIAALLMRSRLPPRKQPPVRQMAVKFAKDMPYILIVISEFFYTQGVFFPIVYLQLDSNSHHLNRTFGFYTLAIMNGMQFFGRLSSGPLVQVLGVFNATCLSCTVAMALIFAAIGIESIVGVVMIAVLFGFSSGAYIALLNPLLTSFATDDSEIGTRMGITYLSIGLGSLIAPPIAGALLTDDFIWWRPIVYAGMMAFTGLMLMVIARTMVARRTGSWKC